MAKRAAFAAFLLSSAHHRLNGFVAVSSIAALSQFADKKTGGESNGY